MMPHSECNKAGRLLSRSGHFRSGIFRPRADTSGVVWDALIRPSIPQLPLGLADGS
jgi:hypothetical protein